MEEAGKLESHHGNEAADGIEGCDEVETLCERERKIVEDGTALLRRKIVEEEFICFIWRM
eukprot:scaffold12703_cov129-Ochromonas_danica.AAC.1